MEQEYFDENERLKQTPNKWETIMSHVEINSS